VATEGHPVDRTAVSFERVDDGPGRHVPDLSDPRGGARRDQAMAVLAKRHAWRGCPERDLLPGVRVPDHHPALGARGQELAFWTEGHAQDPDAPGLEAAEFPAGGGVPELDRPIPAGGGQELSVRTEGYPTDTVGVGGDGPGLLAAGGVPDRD